MIARRAATPTPPKRRLVGGRRPARRTPGAAPVDDDRDLWVIGVVGLELLVDLRPELLGDDAVDHREHFRWGTANTIDEQ
jgi:hypothetical protein